MSTDTQLLGPGCFWYDLYTKYPPNVNWCEQELCGMVIEPANTWSNVSYLILAIAIFIRCRREGLPQFFSAATLLMGFLSFTYHLSLNFFSQFLDFLGMYIFLGLLCTINFKRLRETLYNQTSNFTPVYIGSVIALSILTIIFYYIKVPLQLLVLGMGIFILLSEYKLMTKFSFDKYRNLIIGALTLIVAVSFSIADVTRTWCDPHNHLVQGHAIWHFLSAAGLWFVFLFYRNSLPRR
jgi:hypothetical protein